MVGKLLSFGEGLFSGAMLVLGSVAHLKCIGEVLKPNSDKKETSTQYILCIYIIYIYIYIYVFTYLYNHKDLGICEPKTFESNADDLQSSH